MKVECDTHNNKAVNKKNNKQTFLNVEEFPFFMLLFQIKEHIYQYLPISMLIHSLETDWTSWLKVSLKISH